MRYPWTAKRFELFNFSTTDEVTQAYADFDGFRYSTDFVALSTEVRIGEKVQFRAGTISDKKYVINGYSQGEFPAKVISLIRPYCTKKKGNTVFH